MQLLQTVARYIGRRFQLILVLVANQAMILGIMAFGDYMIGAWRPKQIPHYIWALFDSPLHIIVAILVTAPLCIKPSSPRNTVFRFVLVGLLSAMIDLDHFVAAKSLSLYDAINLLYRPATHSLLFALICAFTAWWITRNPRHCVIIFLALASHLLRDGASGVTPFLLWPVAFKRFSTQASYAAQVGLACLSWTCAYLFYIVRRKERSGHIEY